jgi:23S rRNA pseudouridine1911/1915/1917 synthase
MTQRTFIVPEGAAGERLDTYLAGRLRQTRSAVQRLIQDRYILVNGQPVKTGFALRAGESISVDAPTPNHTQATAPELPIVYQDDELLVIDKPAALAVHAGSGTVGQATVADFARLHTSDPDAERPGIVHRLDLDTSGLMIIAKTPEAKQALQQSFANRSVKKTYQALVVGAPDRDEAVIRLPLERDPAHPMRRAVVPGGRDAVTRYHSVAHFPGYTQIEATPETGRTHQLRVHFAAIGHPIAGDTTYGPRQRPLGLKRHFLHAAGLSFTTPSGVALQLSSPLPAELAKVLRDLADKV